MNQQPDPNQPSKSLKCPLCAYVGKNRTDKHRHALKTHGSDALKKQKEENCYCICPVCKKPYMTENSFRLHVCVKSKMVSKIQGKPQPPPRSTKTQQQLSQARSPVLTVKKSEAKLITKTQKKSLRVVKQTGNFEEAKPNPSTKRILTTSLRDSKIIQSNAMAGKVTLPLKAKAQKSKGLARSLSFKECSLEQIDEAPANALIQELNLESVEVKQPEQEVLPQPEVDEIDFDQGSLKTTQAQTYESRMSPEELRLFKIYKQMHVYIENRSKLLYGNIYVSKSSQDNKLVCGIATRSKEAYVIDPMIEKNNASVTYGEICKGSFHKIMVYLKMHGMNSDSVFYDLGSGFGKIVFQAALETSAKCVGIEIVSERVVLSQQILKDFKAKFESLNDVKEMLEKIEFVQQSFSLLNDLTTSDGLKATHIYSFASRLTLDHQKELVHLIDRCPKLEYAVVTSNIQQLYEKLGKAQFKSVINFNLESTGKQSFVFHVLKRVESKNIIDDDSFGSDIQKEEQKEEQKIESVLSKRSQSDRGIKVANLEDSGSCNKHQFEQSVVKRQKTESSQVSIAQQQPSTTSHSQLLLQQDQQVSSLLDQVVKQNPFHQAVLKLQMALSKQESELQSIQNVLRTITNLDELMKVFQPSSLDELYVFIGQDNLYINFVDKEAFLKLPEDHKECIRKMYQRYLRQIEELDFLRQQQQMKIESLKFFQEALQKLQNKYVLVEKDLLNYIKNHLKEKQQFEILTPAGKGSFGRVFKCRYIGKNPPQNYQSEMAIKVPVSFCSQNKTEILTLQKLKTNRSQDFGQYFIAQMIDSITVDKKQLILMQWYNQDLQTLLSKHRLNEKQKLYISYCIIRGLEFAHSKGITHRDLKPANILIDERFFPKICDWGLSQSSIESGTNLYMAPEQFRRDIHINNQNIFKFDSWSLGVVLYMIHELNHPFTKPQLKVMRENYIEQPLPDAIQKERVGIKSVIRKLLCFNPAQRILVSEAAKDKCFEELYKCNFKTLDISKL